MNKISLLIFATLLAFRVSAQSLPNLIPFTRGNLWGYSDSSGKIIIEPKWEKVDFFSNGEAKVFPDASKWNSVCIIDSLGNYIVPPSRHWDGTYWSLNSYDDTGKWGIIDKGNKIKIPFIYDKISRRNSQSLNTFLFNENKNQWFLIAEKDGKQGIIGKSNTVLIPFDYEDIYFVQENIYSKPNQYDYFIVRKKEKYGLINFENHLLIPPMYDSVIFNLETFKNLGYITIQENGKSGIIDSNNRMIVSPKRGYNFIFPKERGFVITDSTKHFYGWLNAKGKEIAKPIYSNDYFSHGPSFLMNGMMTMEKEINGKVKMSLLDSNGKTLIPAIYDYIYIRNDSIIASNKLSEKDNVRLEQTTVYQVSNLKILSEKITEKDIKWLNNFRSLSTTQSTDLDYKIKGVHKNAIYDKDSIQWHIRKPLTFPESKKNKYWIVATSNYPKDTEINNPTHYRKTFYSVIDENAEFKVPFQSDYIITGGIISKNRLYLQDNKGKIALSDTQFHLISPFMSQYEISSITLKGKEYLIITTPIKRPKNYSLFEKHNRKMILLIL